LTFASPDGARLAVSAVEGDVSLVDVATGRVLATLRGDGHTRTSLTWVSGGTCILVGGPGETAAWRVESNTVTRTSLVHGSRTYMAALSPVSRRIAFLTGRSTVEVWGR